MKIKTSKNAATEKIICSMNSAPHERESTPGPWGRAAGKTHMEDNHWAGPSPVAALCHQEGPFQQSEEGQVEPHSTGAGQKVLTSSRQGRARGRGASTQEGRA